MQKVWKNKKFVLIFAKYCVLGTNSQLKQKRSEALLLDKSMTSESKPLALLVEKIVHVCQVFLMLIKVLLFKVEALGEIRGLFLFN